MNKPIAIFETVKEADEEIKVLCEMWGNKPEDFVIETYGDELYSVSWKE